MPHPSTIGVVTNSLALILKRKFTSVVIGLVFLSTFMSSPNQLQEAIAHQIPAEGSPKQSYSQTITKRRSFGREERSLGMTRFSDYLLRRASFHFVLPLF